MHFTVFVAFGVFFWGGGQVIEKMKQEKDSVGGIVTCVCRGVPPGIGEVYLCSCTLYSKRFSLKDHLLLQPCFDKLEAMLAHAMLSIPATKGFEIGSGFRGTCECHLAQYSSLIPLKTCYRSCNERK